MLFIVMECSNVSGCFVLEVSWIFLIEIFVYGFDLKIMKGKFNFVLFGIWCIGDGVYLLNYVFLYICFYFGCLLFLVLYV